MLYNKRDGILCSEIFVLSGLDLDYSKVINGNHNTEEDIWPPKQECIFWTLQGQSYIFIIFYIEH